MPASAQQAYAAGTALDTHTGILRPAIFIGIGSFGRRALQQLKVRLVDRVGQVSQMPCLRFVYIDPDPGAAEKAVNTSPDMALSSDQVFIAPLQPPANYRRKQMEQLLDWLPREKMNALARNPRVDGSRCLGRLAFADNYMRFITRIRQELAAATHPDSVDQSASYSGLAKRSTIPSIYIFSSASGGTSGMLLDVGHAVRRSLEKLNISSNSTMSAFVMTGAPHDPGTSAEELANTFATLTELNHYADPDTTFTANYGGPDGNLMGGRGLPFNSVYLVPMAKRSREGLHDAISYLAGYIAYDVTTALGAGLDRQRHLPPARDRSPFRGFGTFGIWYPRGLLLRSAARQVCIDFFRTWSSNATTLPPSAEQILTGILAESRLTPEPLQDFIVRESTTKTDGNPIQNLAHWWQDVNQQAEVMIKKGDVANWASGIWDAAREMLGMEPTTLYDSRFRRGRLSKALDVGFKRTVEAWDQELAARFHCLETLPGQRLGVAEFVIDQLLQSAAGAIATLETRVRSFAERREGTKLACQDALELCHSGGGSFTLFGNRMVRNARNFLAKVKEFLDLRREEDLACCTLQFYKRLHQRFEERKLAYKSARERISRLAELLEAPIILGAGNGSGHNMTGVDEAVQTTMQNTQTMRVVLPHGEDNLDRSASGLIEAISRTTLQELEELLTKTILTPRGGLTAMSANGSDLIQHLANPIIEQAAQFLSRHLPSEDVAAVELNSSRLGAEEFQLRMSGHYRGAEPLTGGILENEKVFLLHPETDAGFDYARAVRQMLPNVVAMPIHGSTTDLLFCREQTGLRTPDLMQLIEPCWEAYQNALRDIHTNPHSRLDITQWLPLVD